MKKPTKGRLLLFKPWITEYIHVFRPFGPACGCSKIAPGDFCPAFDGMSPLIIIFYSRLADSFQARGNFVNLRHSK
jgi:hypothetical protein